MGCESTPDTNPAPLATELSDEAEADPAPLATELSDEAEAEPNTLRSATGQAPECDGASVDPEALTLLELEAHEGQLADAIIGAEALVGAHPRSATARVRLGELLLRTRPPSAERAQRFFARGLALHERGCTLADRDLWAALEGAGLSRMMAGQYAEAHPFFSRSLERFPGVRATRYNLACVQCRTGSLEACERSLSAVLDPDAPAPPAFLVENRRPPEHYRDLAGRDPDLATLRADPERFARALSRP